MPGNWTAQGPERAGGGRGGGSTAVCQVGKQADGHPANSALGPCKDQGKSSVLRPAESYRGQWLACGSLGGNPGWTVAPTDRALTATPASCTPLATKTECRPLPNMKSLHHHPTLHSDLWPRWLAGSELQSAAPPLPSHLMEKGCIHMVFNLLRFGVPPGGVQTHVPLGGLARAALSVAELEAPGVCSRRRVTVKQFTLQESSKGVGAC